MSRTIVSRNRRLHHTSRRYEIAIAIICTAVTLALVATALVFAPKPTQAAEGELYIDSFTSPTGWGITGFNTSSGNYAFCIDPPAYPPVGTTMTSWAWTGEAQGIIPDPHALAYLMWAVANNARGFETPVESTVIATWLLCPPAEVDLDSGDYTNGRQSANIYEGYGTRVSRNDRDKIWAVAEEARAHAGQEGPWDRASRVWYSPESSLQNIVEMLPNGTITLSKHSAAASVTDGNACYSLEGAHYSVWRDPGCTEYAGFDFYTDANGYAELRDTVPTGTYYVREEGAPRGYALDPTVYTVEVSAGEESNLDTYERPLYDSGKMWVQKVDADTGEPVPEGGGSLEGAEFTLRYYENEAGDTQGEPTREWVLRTDKDGVALLDDEHKISGPDLCRTEQGDPCMPIGTVTVQETRPPAGYLPEGKDGPNAPVTAAPIHTHVITGDGSGLSVVQRNVDTIPEKPVRGGVSLVKEDSKSGGRPQGNADLSDIKFDIVSNNDNPVWVGGTEYHRGDHISGYLVTDAKGRASTPSDLLPYGSYTIVEAETNESMRRTAGPQDATVSEDEQVVTFRTKDDKESPFKDEVVHGGVRVGKVDAELGEDGPQGAATLEGAEFTIYNRSENPVWVGDKEYKVGAAVAKIVTDKDGVAQTAKDALPYGTYEVRETKAPEGYLLNADWKPSVKVEKDGTFVELTYEPKADPERACPEQVVRGGIALTKEDVESGKTPQGDASLANIRFDIVNKNPNPVVVGGKTYKPEEAIGGLLVTDEKGRASTAKDALPYGTYEVREAETNESMRKTAGPQSATVSKNTEIVKFKTKDDKESPFKDEVVRGGVRVGKIDRESRLHEPQGKAKLSGAVFTITNVSANPVKVDGKLYAPGQVVFELTTGEDGKAETGAKTLPYGSYEIREKTPPEGYLSDAEWVNTFQIREDEVVVDKSEPVDSAANQAKRGDVEGLKVGEGNMGRLPSVPFVLKSLTTGEWHIIVTDENGEFDTSAGNWSHLQNTNANDAAVSKEGDDQWKVTDETMLTPDAGTWFSGYSDYSKNPTPRDELGALPYDTYQVTELRCKANADRELVSFPVTIRRDKRSVNAGTIDDGYAPSIHTFAHAEGSEAQEVSANGTVRITDTVSYDQLDAGSEYRFSGTLHVRNADGTDGGALKDAAGNEVTASTDAKVHAASGTADVTFEFSGSLLDGRDLVAFERVSKVKDGNDVASHEDITDQDQTVRVRPDLHTLATDAMDSDHEAPSIGTVTIRDEVSYSALIAGKEYTLTGTLMDKATGKALLDAEGKEITATKTFVPEKGSGLETIELTVDGGLLRGKTAVVFETVSHDGTEVATHADIEDHDQTVTFPEIGTTATVGGEKAAEATRETTVTDVVSYENLVPGVEYKITGTLVDKATGAPLSPNEDGHVVANEVAFTPEGASGTIAIDLTFDASEYGDVELVAFEELTNGGEKVAEHADVSDEGQTVHVKARVGTTATDPIDGDHELPGCGTVTVRDDVRYEGLRPHTEYIVTGTLHERLSDGSDGGVIKDAGGNAIVATKAFTPERGTGTVAVEIAVDGSLLAGRTAVAFESVARDGVEIAAHADINDRDQTVTFPKIGTTATASRGKATIAEGATTISDEIRYENLTVGTEYRVTGHLMDKATGRPVEGTDGKRVASTKGLKPTEPSGSITLDLTFDAREHGDSDFVVFEELTKVDEANGEEKVAEHVDIDDANQTIRVQPKIATIATDPTDGDHELPSIGPVIVRDEIKYQGLCPNKEYVVSGTLVDKATGRAIANAEGEGLSATKRFRPERGSGLVCVEFTVDGSLLAGKTAVAFESISADGVEVAVHADIDDRDQTLTSPRICTSARVDSITTDKREAESLVVVDTVRYENLVPNTEYTLKGLLFDKSTGTFVGGEGEPVTAEETFTPAQSSGTVDVRFGYDRSLTVGSTAVAFESLYKDGQKVAEHADAEDEDQRFDTPAIYTTASDKSDGDKQVNGIGRVAIQDTVLHRGLEKGKRYTLQGKLIDKETGAPICGSDGSEIVAERAFTAESADGIVPIDFCCDGRLLSGKTAVVFEELMRDGKVVARHADIDDAAQSVEGARIRTMAKDGADGDKNVSPNGDQTVVDTVRYAGLTPGKTYTLTATLLGKSPEASAHAGAGSDGMVESNYPDALANGVTTFRPESSEGTAEVRMACRPEAYAGQDLVVFESLTTEEDGEGKGEIQAVADHVDPDDDDQTVHVDGPTRAMPQTGIDTVALAASAVGVSSIGFAASRLLGRRLYRRRRR